jgi:hypothetical protein
MHNNAKNHLRRLLPRWGQPDPKGIRVTNPHGARSEVERAADLDVAAGVPHRHAEGPAPSVAKLAENLAFDTAHELRAREDRMEPIRLRAAELETRIEHIEEMVGRAHRAAEEACDEVDDHPRHAYGGGVHRLAYILALAALALSEWPLNRWSLARIPIADWGIQLLVVALGGLLVFAGHALGVNLAELSDPKRPASPQLRVKVRTEIAFAVIIVIAAAVFVVTFNSLRISDLGPVPDRDAATGAFLAVQILILSLGTWLSWRRHLGAARQAALAKLERAEERHEVARRQREALKTALARAELQAFNINQEFDHRLAALIAWYRALAMHWYATVVRSQPEQQTALLDQDPGMWSDVLRHDPSPLRPARAGESRDELDDDDRARTAEPASPCTPQGGEMEVHHDQPKDDNPAGNGRIPTELLRGLR